MFSFRNICHMTPCRLRVGAGTDVRSHSLRNKIHEKFHILINNISLSSSFTPPVVTATEDSRDKTAKLSVNPTIVLRALLLAKSMGRIHQKFSIINKQKSIILTFHGIILAAGDPRDITAKSSTNPTIVL